LAAAGCLELAGPSARRMGVPWSSAAQRATLIMSEHTSTPGSRNLACAEPEHGVTADKADI
jgi:hypothetical protein